MKNLFSRYKVVYLALIFIVLLGAFLRLYHLSDWLHFELDQARDAKVIVSALNGGIGNLTLLGPRAGGTFLRLGPGFYYMEYLGALVFGGSPWGFAMPVALLSIASIAVFFFLSRRYFETKLSLGLTLLFSVSAFMVLYGRFAWNPNPVPFFLMAGFYSLLKAVDVNERYKDRWFIAAAFLLSFATHLHFLAFVALPLIVGVFLIVKRARFSWKVWVLALSVALLLYVPVLLNEMITGGANMQEFIQAVYGKSNKSNHTLAEQVVHNTTNTILGYWVMLTGYEESTMGQFTGKSAFDFNLTCNDSCRKHLVSGFLATAVFIFGGILLVGRFWKEMNPRKKDFLFLSILWFGACFALFTPLSYNFSPRFFLLIAPFPFIFLGLTLDFFQQFLRKYTVTPYVIGLLLLVFMASNMFYVTHRLDELRLASIKNFDTLPDRILKEKARVTFIQQSMILDYMQSFQKANGYSIYMFSEPEHKRAIKYLMDRRGMQNDALRFTDGIYAKGNYFLIFRTGSNQDNRLQKYTPTYDIIGKKVIGTLTVFHLQPKAAVITDDIQIVAPKIPKPAVPPPMSASGVPERYTWGEWWNHQGGTIDDEPVDEEPIDTSE